MRKRLPSWDARHLPLVCGGVAALGSRCRATTPMLIAPSLEKRRCGRRYALGALVLMLSMLAGCGSGATGASPTSTTAFVTPTLPAAPGGTISATIPSAAGGIVAGYLYGMAADDTSVWIHNTLQATVTRVDAKTNKIVATIHIAQGMGDVVIGEGSVWVASNDDDTISRIDPATNQVVASIKTRVPGGFLAVSPGAVWVASKENGVLWRIDPLTNQVVATIPIEDGPSWMSYSAGSLWICNLEGEQVGVTRLDPVTNQVLAQIDIGSAHGYFCGGLAASGGAVWVELLDSTQTTVLGLERIDPASNRVSATVPLPESVGGLIALAADAGGVWIAEPQVGLLRIDPQTTKLVGLLPQVSGAGIALGDGAAWLATSGGDLVRIAPSA